MTKNFQAPLNSYNYRCSTVELSDVVPQLRGLNIMKKIGHNPVSTVVSIKPVPHSTWKVNHLCQNIYKLCLVYGVQGHVIKSSLNIVLENACRLWKVFCVTENYIGL